MDDRYYDNLLGIETYRNRFSDYETKNHNRYEATEYIDLELLFGSYELDRNDCLVDFGCGLARMPIFANYKFGCRAKGVEHNRNLYIQAVENVESYSEIYKVNKNRLSIVNQDASDYIIKAEDNVFYFFNPFSFSIFAKVVNNIMKSVEIAERTVDIILYYPDMEYVYYLENKTPFVLIDEILIPRRYGNDMREKFVIYRYSVDALSEKIFTKDLEFFIENATFFIRNAKDEPKEKEEFSDSK